MTSVISAQPSPPLAESPTTVAATAVPVCAAFLEDAYDAYGKTAEAQDSPINEDDTSHTVWHLLTTIYLPILFLRFRRSFFGFANFVLLGLRFLVTYLPMESLSQSPWFVTGAAKADQNSWPPPTLTVLAILTIFAFVVHPDGMTWIMLGKLRNGLFAFLQSSTTCWNVMLQDFGILPTLAAATTFAALVCLVVILHKTLTPKTPRPMPERKKKKKKGHHPRGKGRITGRKPESPRAPPRVEKDATTTTTTTIPVDKIDFLPKELSVEESTRPRVQSYSTGDTAMMDDQSCESISVRSAASAPSASGTTVSQTPESPSTNNALRDDDKKASRTLNKRRNAKRGKKANSNALDATLLSPPRTDSFRAHANNASPSNLPLHHTGRSRSRRSGNQYGRFPRPSESSPPTQGRPGLQEPPLSPTSSLFSRDHFSASLPNTPTASFPYDTKSPARSVGGTLNRNVLYSVPNYAASYSFSRGNGRYAPGKMELAGFLAQVGLVGTACADLLEDLDDVDALSRLSEAQFELYNVAPDTKVRIDLLLEARARSRMAIRPPPGLTANESPLLMSPPRLNHAVEKPPPGYPSPHDARFGTNVPSLSLLSSYDGSSHVGTEDDEENSRIEAELQELGGQMVGSILDFDG